MFAAIDATGYSVIIGAVFIGVLQLATLIVNYLRERDRLEREKEIALKVGQVKEQAEKAAVLLKVNTAANAEKLASMALVGEKTHALVNSAMEAQLRIAALALRRIADTTGDPGDIAAADLAERNLAEHIVKQKRVDAIEKKEG